MDISEEIERLGKKSLQLNYDIYPASPWQVTQIALRHPQRTTTAGLRRGEIFTDFQECTATGTTTPTTCPSSAGWRFNGPALHGARTPEGRDTKERGARNFRHVAARGLPQGL